jgi:hypothetical protein
MVARESEVERGSLARLSVGGILVLDCTFTCNRVLAGSLRVGV